MWSQVLPVMLSLLPSVIALGLAAFAAAFLSWRRPSPAGKTVQRLAAARVLTAAVAIQGIHFAEEAVTGFHERFPGLFGLREMPFSFFVLFNLVWLGIWIVSIRGLRAGRPAAFFAAWFLAIAGALNGIAHPLLAMAAGGYFPGLLSSPLIGVAGVWLWLRLREATVLAVRMEAS